MYHCRSRDGGLLSVSNGQLVGESGDVVRRALKLMAGSTSGCQDSTGFGGVLSTEQNADQPGSNQSWLVVGVWR